MPKRTDIEKILIIGSGPIIIGQGCEFDYSGTQACKALREEGYRVVLLNSNPATIMTDPEMADRTYVEPITVECIEKILVREKATGHPVHAVLPTLGGQTGLNCAMEAAEQGIFEKHGVEMIGAKPLAIHKAENRTAFKEAMLRIGLEVPQSGIAHSWDESLEILEKLGFPCCIRPAYTLGGTGGGFAHTMEEFETITKRGLEYSRVTEILIEEDLYGWKEFELEVMRDGADNVVIVCSIENFDPMGVHTGDSITVAPQQTLTDKEFQRMRDGAIKVIREIGVDTGGANIQFAVDPRTGRQVVIEMNPRVSRSSALASKATGYPIAKIAAKLAVGYTLDEIPNDITRETPASFEPSIDYCVVKIPRWTFEKFPEADETLTTQMKSVGEAMSIGRTFKEAFQKGIRSMEIKRYGFGLDANDKWLANLRGGQATHRDDELPGRNIRENVRYQTRFSESAAGTDGSDCDTGSRAERLRRRSEEPKPDTVEESARAWPIPEDVLRDKLARPCQGRPYYIRYAFKMGWSVDQVHELTRIDPWFLDNLKELEEAEAALTSGAADLEAAKLLGYSDVQVAIASETSPAAVYAERETRGIRTAYKLVDTCAAEFEAYTPYYYSSYENPTTHLSPNAERRAVDDEVRIQPRRKIIVLGGGPNRIGQGIEFDYCCVHAVQAARKAGFETVMINSNPETVSTDYDTSDLLFFEPLTHEDVLNIVERLNGKASGQDEKLVAGVVVQFGGQTPLNLAKGLLQAGAPIIGTSPISIDWAEDREAFATILQELGLRQPPNGICYDVKEAKKIAAKLEYPVLVRPSYVLGGRAMEICNVEADLERYMLDAQHATDRTTTSEDKHPILVDKFIKGATEVDVDCVSDFGLLSGFSRSANGPRAQDGAEGTCVICGMMEHIEEAGIHSGDSACALPPYSLSPEIVDEIKRQTIALARRLEVCGLMNVQFAVRGREVFILEVNPRASRTVPFVSKATGVAWAKVAMRIMMGERLVNIMKELGLTDAPWPMHVSVKEAVFPFLKFPGVDVILGPEMRSTGEVMGIDNTFGLAFAKAQMSAGCALPTQGRMLISVNDADKPAIAPIARMFYELGFELYATVGTRDVLAEAGIDAVLVSKSPDGQGQYLLDLIESRKLDLLVNTPLYIGSAHVEGRWRAAATIHQIPLITTLTGARAAAMAVQALREGEWGVKPLQEYVSR